VGDNDSDTLDGAAFESIFAFKSDDVSSDDDDSDDEEIVFRPRSSEMLRWATSATELKHDTTISLFFSSVMEGQATREWLALLFRSYFHLSSHPFSLDSFFLSLHFSQHTCRSSKRGANGESSVVVIVAYSDGGSFSLYD
jgi:hypothetical protein